VAAVDARHAESPHQLSVNQADGLRVLNADAEAFLGAVGDRVVLELPVAVGIRHHFHGFADPDRRGNLAVEHGRLAGGALR
jgi:hypothetical protein